MAVQPPITFNNAETEAPENGICQTKYSTLLSLQFHLVSFLYFSTKRALYMINNDP